MTGRWHRVDAIAMAGKRRLDVYRERWLAEMGCFIDVYRRVQRIARRVRMARKKRRGWA